MSDGSGRAALKGPLVTHARGLVSLRAFVSLALAVVLALALAPIAVRGADPGGPPTRLTNFGIAYSPTGLVATTGRNVLIAYQEGDGNVSLLRSRDAGSTWLPSRSLSNPQRYVSRGPALAAFGRHVELVWAEGGIRCYEDLVCAVVHRRSDDGGRTWSRTERLSPYGTIDQVAVAVARGGQVTVLWMNGPVIRVRTSLDFGRHFLPRRIVTTGVNQGDGFTSARLAVGSGVTYLLYADLDGRTVLRRSLDRGRTWLRAKVVVAAGDSSALPLLAAHGATVGVAYDDSDGNRVLLESRTKGKTWSRSAAPAGTIDYGHGRWAVAGCTWIPADDGESVTCDVTIWWRKGHGGPWSAPVIIGRDGASRGGPVVDIFREPVNAIAVGGKLLVLYSLTTEYDDYADVDLYLDRVSVGH